MLVITDDQQETTDAPTPTPDGVMESERPAWERADLRRYGVAVRVGDERHRVTRALTDATGGTRRTISL
ncbi:hypothetical protein GCM10009037_21470 [Halarchaeum grantii]|uniref:Uncharacterized protein n=1 Tax=Halarchaeum grantii TaxID=1193105 RepID=A0A830F468_9EURY|nr:hypothetical protein [Halarchaeum grantii]GGL37592.1 hypothetical protein GCM10009037_21470 [Halarchaeum grantii]